MRRRRRLFLLGAAVTLASLVLGVGLADAVAPVLTIQPASGVSFDSATVSGEVDPEGGEAFCHFEYISEAALQANLAAQPPLPEFEGAGQAPCSLEPVSGSGPQLVEAQLSGLHAGTVYHLRLVASNSEGEEATPAFAPNFTTVAVNKPQVSNLVVSAPTASGAHFEATVNSGGSAPGEATEYRFACTPGCPGIEGLHPAASDGTGHTVEATATGLEPHKPYTVTLIATNAGGESETSQAFETGAVLATFATSPLTTASATEATLDVLVNPHNSPLVDCHFEFGPSAPAYGRSLPCEGALPTGNEPGLVTAKVSGLAPSTTYHFRLTATNGAGPASTGDLELETLAEEPTRSCPNEARRVEQHSTFLPDCRAYEKASPSDKNGADVMGVPQRTRAAADGEAVDFASLVAFGDARGTGISTDYLAERDGAPGTSGWATHAITPGPLNPIAFPPQIFGGGLDSRYMGALAPDLEKGVFLSISTPLTSGSPDTEGVPNLYLRDDLLTPGAGHYQLVSDCPACTAPLVPPEADDQDQPAFAGASADFSHVIFEATQDLTADAPPDPNCAAAHACLPRLYEFHDGTVTLAGLIPPPGDTECGPSPLPACQAAPSSQAGQGALVNSTVTPANQRYARNAISGDGSRIYFTVRSADTASGPLYLRTNNGTPDARTVRIDAAEPNPNPTSLEDARFWGATPDGSKVFFTTKENLISSDTSSENTTDLYMYDVEAQADHRLTRISTPDPGRGADVQGVIGISDDGSYVYFISAAQLVANYPTSNDHRIFVWHDGVIHNIGAIPVGPPDEVGLIGTASWGVVARSSRVSPDGTSMLFRSKTPAPVDSESLPHSGTGDACPAAEGCEEIYLYDATADGGQGQVTCVSCQPGDPEAPSRSDATFLPRVGRGVAGLTDYLNHPLSADGRYVFFDTADRLLPEDTDNAPDVYEYDTRTGQLHLISSGTDPGGSYFMDASADGSNVFFITRQRLLGWDTDGAIDLYDARVGGGFPEPAAEVAECAGAGCRPGGAAAPGAASAGTVGFNGPANPRAVCKKGFVKKHGKCAKKSNGKKHHKKHSGKKHHGKKPSHKGGGGK